MRVTGGDPQDQENVGDEAVQKVLIFLHSSSPIFSYLHLPGDIIPYDGVPLEEVVTISIYITVVYSILAAAGILFAVVCLAFICTLRTRK